VVVSQKNALPSEDVFSIEHDSGLAIASNRAVNPDETLVLSTLKNLVAAGEHQLDPMLAAISDAALRLTDASGVALAMWKDGAMVCRARSGKTAPAIGARLSADKGISGACLRTGNIQHCYDAENHPLVDAEVCRSLGLRSLAVLPIQRGRAINGILEAFSTEPGAFTEHHLAVLEQLAAFAERARGSQPDGASPVLVKSPPEELKRNGLLPASDRFGDVALAFMGRRSRPVVLGAIVLAALLLGFVIWLGWRTPSGNSGRARPAPPAISPTETAGAQGRRLPDTDPVWKANPGGERLSSSGGKTSAGIKAAPNANAGGKKSAGDRPLLVSDAVRLVSPEVAAQEPIANTSQRAKPRTDEAVAVEPPPIPAGESNPAALNSVLSTRALLPTLPAPVSQGVSGGRLLHRVPPIYPNQAKILGIEGKVVMSATVAEDGSIREIKVVQGQPTLAQAATDAVKQWRYQPYKLDGKTVKMTTTIIVDFKLPSDKSSR
jgi:TonB family protein